MSKFNPEKYLAEKKGSGFDPAAYLAKKGVPQVDTDERSTASRIGSAIIGGPATMASELAKYAYGERAVEAAGKGLVQGALSGVTDYPMVEKKARDVLSSAGLADQKTIEELRAEYKALTDEYPGISGAYQGAGTVASAALLPAAKAAGLAGRMGQAALIGGGIGAAQDIDKELGVRERLENAAVGGGLGIAGEGAIKAVGAGYGASKNLLKKISAEASGVSEKAMETFAKRYKEIDKLAQKYGGDLAATAEDMRDGFMKSVMATKNELAQATSNIIAKGKNQIVDSGPIVDKVLSFGDDLLKKSPKDQGIQKDINILLQEVSAHSNPDGTMAVDNLYKLKQKLQDYAAPAYGDNKSFFTDAKRGAQLSKMLANVSNKELKKAVPEIIPINKKYELLHQVEKSMNKNLVNKDGPIHAMLAAGNASPMGARTYTRLGELTGTQMLEQAENLAAMEAFAKPNLLSRYGTGRSVTGTVVGSTLGGAAGALSTDGNAESMGTGFLTGAALSSPYMIKKAIQGGRYIPTEEMIRRLVKPSVAGSIGGQSSARIKALLEE